MIPFLDELLFGDWHGAVVAGSMERLEGLLGFLRDRPELGADVLRGAPAAGRGGTADLVDVDGSDEDGADRDLLPEGLHAGDDEAVLEDGGDEQADDGAEDRAVAAEERRTADDDGGDDVEVRLRLTGDRGGAELRQRQDAGETGESTARSRRCG